jgi:hypothetical protein
LVATGTGGTLASARTQACSQSAKHNLDHNLVVVENTEKTYNSSPSAPKRLSYVPRSKQRIARANENSAVAVDSLRFRTMGT